MARQWVLGKAHRRRGEVQKSQGKLNPRSSGESPTFAEHPARGGEPSPSDSCGVGDSAKMSMFRHLRAASVRSILSGLLSNFPASRHRRTHDSVRLHGTTKGQHVRLSIASSIAPQAADRSCSRPEFMGSQENRRRRTQASPCIPPKRCKVSLMSPHCSPHAFVQTIANRDHRVIRVLRTSRVRAISS